jgi:hypothetical protein
VLSDNSGKIILDLCGGTGAWSRPYKEAGYDVRVITLPEHDVRLYAPPDNVYGILAAPPCTEFSRAKHFHGKGKYHHDFLKGLEVVSACMRIIIAANPKFWALENPLGYLVDWLKKPQFVFDAWQFGDNHQKRTALWGEFNKPVVTVTEKPPGLVKFSMLKSREIYPEYFGILSRQERRAITPPRIRQGVFLG